MIEKHAGGRPLKFKTVEELQAKIDEYFAISETYNNAIYEGTKKGRLKPPNIAGLSLHLNICYNTFLNYRDKDEFLDTIANARLRCVNYCYEELLGGRNQLGARFALMNFGFAENINNNNTEKPYDKETDYNNPDESAQAYMDLIKDV